MKKYNPYILIALFFISIVSLIYLEYKKPKEVQEETQKECQTEVYINPYNFDEFLYYNEDFVGVIKIGELIELPFVQGDSNTAYIRTDWKTGSYDEEGSIFMDYENTLDDQNITLYGHYVYASYDKSGTHKFTPLAKLLKEENYEENKYVEIYLKDEVRKYEIVAVYLCPLENDGAPDNLQYYRRNFDEDYFTLYKKAIQEKQVYPIDINYSEGNYFLTLQTCVENKDDLREVILCKLIERHY